MNLAPQHNKSSITVSSVAGGARLEVPVVCEAADKRRIADAEDVLQDALVKLARKVEEGSFVGGQDAWIAFIYTQIRREAIDLGRKDDRRRRREENVIKDDRSLGRDIEMPLFEGGASQEETRQYSCRGHEDASHESLPK